MANNNVDIDITTIKVALEMAKEYNLEVEVITWAMKALKEDNKLTISQAISIGVAEWLK